MDSSNRLASVLRPEAPHRIHASELEAADWAKIVLEVIDICRPILKYLSAMRPVAKVINPDVSYGNSYNTYPAEPTEVQPEDFDLTIKCVPIISNNFGHEGEAGHALGVRFFETYKVLLAANGTLYLLHTRTKRIPRYGLGYRAHRTGIESRVISCRFSVIEGAEQLAHVINAKKMQHQFFQTITQILQNDIRARQARLQAMQDRFRMVVEIQGRITFFP